MLTNDYREGGGLRVAGDEEQVISLQWPSSTHPLSRLDYMTLCNNTEIIEVLFFHIDPLYNKYCITLQYNFSIHDTCTCLFIVLTSELPDLDAMVL